MLALERKLAVQVAEHEILVSAHVVAAGSNHAAIHADTYRKAKIPATAMAADAATIDQIMKLGMAHPMGPLQLADYIGLDVCKNILEIMEAGFENNKYKPAALLSKMVAEGKLGVKSGSGFYDYNK